MFTGIVQEVGVVLDLSPADGGSGAVLRVRAGLVASAEIGASVSVSGTCLTVTEHDGPGTRFDVSPETLGRTTLGALTKGHRVNLERALRAGDELGGHLVQGHVDGVAEVAEVEDDVRGRRVTVELPADLSRYVVEKGSITLDGVSLTVAALAGRRVDVALIPHTLHVTTLGATQPGDRMNVEVDVLAKYVERMVGPWADRAWDPASAKLT